MTWAQAGLLRRAQQSVTEADLRLRCKAVQVSGRHAERPFRHGRPVLLPIGRSSGPIPSKSGSRSLRVRAKQRWVKQRLQRCRLTTHSRSLGAACAAHSRRSSACR